jgi:hypothetical protein
MWLQHWGLVPGPHPRTRRWRALPGFAAAAAFSQHGRLGIEDNFCPGEVAAAVVSCPLRPCSYVTRRTPSRPVPSRLQYETFRVASPVSRVARASPPSRDYVGITYNSYTARRRKGRWLPGHPRSRLSPPSTVHLPHRRKADLNDQHNWDIEQGMIDLPARLMIGWPE